MSDEYDKQREDYLNLRAKGFRSDLHPWATTNDQLLRAFLLECCGHADEPIDEYIAMLERLFDWLKNGKAKGEGAPIRLVKK